MMKKINWTVVGLCIITMTELFLTKDMNGSITLWLFYGCYKYFK